MKRIDWKEVWQFVRVYLLNKYFVVCAVFAIVLCFCGNQSVVNRVKMHYEIKEKERELREYERKIAETEADLRALENPDSLERFAREHYKMHADGEDVYLIDD